ncbi:MAG: DUF362 domain-containing protein [Candidatus Aminicenantia bacterium]
MERKFSRREFLLSGIGIMGISFLGDGKAFPGYGSNPQRKTKVALLKCGNRKEGVRKSVEKLGINPFRQKDVFIKPNFNTSDLTPGSTHNDTLREIMALIKDMGGKKIKIGDRSGPEPTEQVLNKKGIHELAKEFNAEVINFDELGESGYVKIVPPDSHWKDGFLVAKPLLDAECIVSTCCIKTHQFGGIFTISLKNSVGIIPRKGYPYMRELHSSPYMRKMIAEINYSYTPSLIIVDGVEVFVDGGPMDGKRKIANVFLAGTDRIAIDAVGIAILKELGSNKNIMENKIFKQEQIARAIELGLGIHSFEEIELVGYDEESSEYTKKILNILKKEAI